MLATRHDLRLGLHRLRLEGELTEIRADDLRFSRGGGAGAVRRGRGGAGRAGAGACCTSGPRAGRPGCGWPRCRWPGTPIRSGSRPSSPAASGRWPSTCWPRCWSGRASRCGGCCCGPACWTGSAASWPTLLTGGSGGERILQELEEANAFVVSLDAARSWFRYHRLFADLLQLELRRTAPGEVTALHRAAAQWFAEHGYPVEAIRHAQAAQDWGLAARLLADHWPGLHLGGQAATVHALLAGFPAEAAEADAELAALAAADELAQGSLEEAERYLTLRGAGIGVGAGRPARAGCRSCSGWSGCCWPGSAATCRRWPRRRGGCRTWPRPRTRRSPAWARSCARWR